LRGSSIGGLLDLVGPPLGESDGEEAEEVVIGGLDDNVGLNEGLPLADERAELVGGEVEAVEVGQAVLALDLVDPELDLAERVVLILLEIGERDLEYPALEGVVCVLETGGAVDEGLADAAEKRPLEYIPPRPENREKATGILTLGSRRFPGPSRCTNPIDNQRSGPSLKEASLGASTHLFGEGIGLLLETLLSLGKALVLADSHDCDPGFAVAGVVVVRSSSRAMISMGRGLFAKALVPHGPLPSRVPRGAAGVWPTRQPLTTCRHHVDPTRKTFTNSASEQYGINQGKRGS
jgi:hypothetical protein